MKTDRELLELAAKAAGYDVKWRTKVDIGMLDALLVDIPLDSQQLRWKVNPYSVWNPLTDDGDALRLAVKLEMVIDSMDGRVIAGDMSDILIEYDPATDNPCVELRRAIVRAAAAIGESML